MGWGRGATGAGFLLRVALRMLAFVLLSVAFVTILGYLGAAVLGIATAPVGSVVVGILVVVGLGIAAGLAFRSMRRAGRPLDRLVVAAARVEAGDYSVRVPEDGPADLRGLQRAFNQMTARLEDADTARRAFLAEVSHELRTPLTVMRGQLEAIADGVYPADDAHLAPVLAQTDVLERLVDDLRTVALAESGALAVRREPVELAGLAASVAAGFAAAATDAGVTLAVAPADLPAVAADPALLRRVLANLLTNALRHTPAGGSVRVEVMAPTPGRQRLAVSDTGPGIPPELLPRVFERFVKGPGSEGTGLGLAIARDLVVAHGGTIAAHAPPEGGTRIEIELPSGR
jgi:two-component system sensor histidine kinase BaeS